MNMKKITALAAALAVALSMSACNSDSGSADADVSTTASKTENVKNETSAELPVEVVEPTAEDFEYNYDAALKGVVITKYNGEAIAIRIPTELDGDPVAQVRLDNPYITYVEIPEGFTKISRSMFSKCSSLKDVKIPNSVTEIDEYAFSKCGIENITIPNSVTRIWEDAFNDCDALIEITIPNSVKEFGYWEAFDNTGCGHDVFSSSDNLETVILPEKLEQEHFGGFSHCKNLKEITIPDGVKKISNSIGSFFECESLESVTIPHSVEVIGCNAFRGCKNLKEINIPNSVKCIADCAFEECESLKEVKLPDGIILCYRSFIGCRGLRNIVLPDDAKRYGDEIFYGCNGLTVTYKGNDYNYTNFDDLYNAMPQIEQAEYGNFIF